jgi:hypothetical protein
MDRTDRIDVTVEDLMMQSGLHWLGIGSRKCENEYHCMLGSNQYVATQMRNVVILLGKM